MDLNQDGTFTCEFSTSIVGEHKIEIIISDERLNVTPSFYTYDASKIKVGQIPMGYIGLPVEFDSKYLYIRTVNTVKCTYRVTKKNYVFNFN